MLSHKDWRPLLWAMVGLMAVGMAVSFFAWHRGDRDAGGGMMAGWTWMPFLFVMVLMMAFMLSMGGHSHGHVGPRDDALAVLDRRYAAGEITREECQRMRSDLERRP